MRSSTHEKIAEAKKILLTAYSLADVELIATRKRLRQRLMAELEILKRETPDKIDPAAEQWIERVKTMARRVSAAIAALNELEDEDSESPRGNWDVEKPWGRP